MARLTTKTEYITVMPCVCTCVCATSTDPPRALAVVRADEILTRQTGNKSCQPRNSVTDTKLLHSNDCIKKEMLEIVCLAWKFMRLHVAISFEKLMFSSFFFFSKDHKRVLVRAVTLLLGERSLIMVMMMMIKKTTAVAMN